MTKIKNYELDSTINDDNKIIGTDGLPGPNFGNTKNYSIGSLEHFTEEGILKFLKSSLRATKYTGNL